MEHELLLNAATTTTTAIKTEPRVQSPTGQCAAPMVGLGEAAPVAVAVGGSSTSSNGGCGGGGGLFSNIASSNKRTRADDWLASPSPGTIPPQAPPLTPSPGPPSLPYTVISNGYSSPMSSGSYDPYSPNGKIDQGIDSEAFSLLTENIITQLIPKIGARLKFLNKFRITKNALICDDQHSDANKENTDPVLSSSDSTITITSENADLFLSDLDFDIPLSSSELMPPPSTSDVVDVVIQHLLKTFPDYKIPATAFSQAAEEIVKIFPKEEQSVYFIPYHPKTSTAPKRLTSTRNRIETNMAFYAIAHL